MLSILDLFLFIFDPATIPVRVQPAELMALACQQTNYPHETGKI